MRVQESVLEVEGGSVAWGTDIPFGDPRRLINGFAIPASWSVIKLPRVGLHPIFCSCEALGVGPMNKADCFNYIKANQLNEFCTVPVPWVAKNTPWEVTTFTLPPGDLCRKIIPKNYNGCIPPASWTITANPEDTIRWYEQEGVWFTDTVKFLKYLKTQSPKEYAAMLASQKRS